MLDGDPAPLPKRGGASEFSAHVCCGQTAGWIKMALGMEVWRRWSRPYCARWGPRSPPKKGAEPPPIFGPSLLWPNGGTHQQDATWYEGRPQPGRLCVRWGSNLSPIRAEAPAEFSAHIYCGQTAAWIKMPLGMEVGLGLRDIVFDVYVNMTSQWANFFIEYDPIFNKISRQPKI